MQACIPNDGTLWAGGQGVRVQGVGDGGRGVGDGEKGVGIGGRGGVGEEGWG